MTPAESLDHAKDICYRLCCLAVNAHYKSPLIIAKTIAKSSADNVVENMLSSMAPPENLTVAKEIQEEILHFSRIVDLAWLEGPPGSKRLRRSIRIPQRLRFLAELFLVSRSRLQQSNKTSAQMLELFGEQHQSHNSFIAGSAGSDFLLIAMGGRKSARREIAFFLKLLLNHLTPVESFYALSYYCRVVKPNREIGLELYFQGLDSEKAYKICLSTDTNGQSDRDLGRWLLDVTPSVRDEAGIRARISTDSFKFFHRGEEVSIKLKKTNGRILRKDKKEVVEQLCHFENRIRSLECGHIHLDRDIDADQAKGIEIGSSIAEFFSNRGKSIPVLPLIDDDHVSCVLRPEEIESLFYDAGFSGVTMIPESSPIIRMIVVVIYDRWIKRHHAKHLREIGDNLYLELGDSIVVELFEDVDGSCATGCILFEVALLLYRSKPSLFDSFFRRLYPEEEPHKEVLRILSSDATPLEKYERVSSYYQDFSNVTSPFDIDTETGHFLEAAINEIHSQKPIHINVLESYYHSQQEKVRFLLGELGLGIGLVSIYFDRNTGLLDVEGNTTLRTGMWDSATPSGSPPL